MNVLQLLLKTAENCPVQSGGHPDRTSHRPYMGVVPEVASRIHVEWITGVVKEALKEADTSLDDIDGIAVTNRPGLNRISSCRSFFCKRSCNVF